MKNKGIVYRPEKSIKEIAESNKVSESAVRKYIKVNGIDRKGDNVILIKRDINELRKKEPNVSISEMAKILHRSPNTIKKYLKDENDPSKIDTSKVSVFDLSKRKFRISSVSDSQDEILNNILRLYVKKDRFECDITYSKGNFYKRLFPPPLKFDKYPLSEDVMPLEEFYKIQDNSLTSLIFDLPFVLKSNWKKGSKIIRQYESFDTIEELYDTNRHMVDISHSKLVKHGILVIKTMDLNEGENFHSIYTFLVNYAESKGFKLIDTFILIATRKILMKLNKEQRHARKFHSYFLVFQKKQSK